MPSHLLLLLEIHGRAPSKLGPIPQQHPLAPGTPIQVVLGIHMVLEILAVWMLQGIHIPVRQCRVDPEIPMPIHMPILGQVLIRTLSEPQKVIHTEPQKVIHMVHLLLIHMVHPLQQIQYRDLIHTSHHAVVILR